MISLQDYPILGEPGDQNDTDSPDFAELEAEAAQLAAWEAAMWAEREAVAAKVTEHEASLPTYGDASGFDCDAAEYQMAYEADAATAHLTDDQYYEALAELEWFG